MDTLICKNALQTWHKFKLTSFKIKFGFQVEDAIIEQSIITD
jgi:hypothetical protein